MKELLLGVYLWRGEGSRELLNTGVSVHDGDIEEGAHVPMLGPFDIPAVSSKTEIAAAEVEDQHPSVDDKAECLKVSSL